MLLISEEFNRVRVQVRNSEFHKKGGNLKFPELKVD